MIDYELYCKIKDCHDRHHLTVAQIARELHLDERTVARWLAMEKFRPRQVTPRPGKLVPPAADRPAPRQAGPVQGPDRPLAGAPSVYGHAGVPAAARGRLPRPSSRSTSATFARRARRPS